MISKRIQTIIIVILVGVFLAACNQNGGVSETKEVSYPPENVSGQVVVSAPDVLIVQDGEITNEAILSDVDIFFNQDMPGQVMVTIQGTLPDDCVSVESVNLALNGTAFAVAVATLRQTEDTCVTRPQSFQETVSLPSTGLPAGTYAVSINGSNIINTSFTLTADMVQSLATPTPAQLGATIEGIVWNDDCQLADNNTFSGCITTDDGSLQANGIIDSSESRIAGVEVSLLYGQCPGTEPLVLTTTNEIGMYRLTGLQPGLYCVTVNTSSPANAAIFVSGGWTYPGLNSSSATVSLTEDNYQSADFGYSFQPVVQAVPELDASVVNVDSPDCRNAAIYIADVTIADNTVLAYGTEFEKTWRVQNQGDCVWSPAYRLVFDGGELMDGPTALPFNQEVKPGQDVDLSVPLVAPLVAGSYRGDWKIQDPTGSTFGSRGDYPFYVQIIVETSAPLASVQPEPGDATSAIQGVVWQDYCGVLSDGSPSSGCIKGSNGAYQANGIFDDGEAILSGVSINLSRGSCTGGQILSSTTSGADGVYQFTEIKAGTYCIVALPPPQTGNSILVSGRWSYPAIGVGYTTVVVESGSISKADFGWSYWLQ